MTRRTPVDLQPPVAADAKAATPWVGVGGSGGAGAEQDLLAGDRPARRPALCPILGLWLDDVFYFITGKATRQGKNLAAYSRCLLTASSQVLSALDVIARYPKGVGDTRHSVSELAKGVAA
jgi:hypothetical protein